MSADKPPVRIMNIIARLNVGGPAVYVALLTERFGPPDYDSSLVCGVVEAYEGDMTYYAVEHGIHPVILPTLGRSLNPLRDITTIWQIYQLIRKVKPDIVHTHTAKAGFVGRVAAWLAGVPVILHTFHGHVFRGYFSPTKTQFFILLERITARMSDTIITLTESLRRELAEDFHIARKGKITVLPLGLDLDVYRRMPRHIGTFRKAWNIPLDVPLVGIVGRITPIKNHALFLQAAARLRQQMPNAHFVIVGDGETRAETDALVDQLGLRDCVTFTGWQRDLPPIYSDLDVLVISSLNEGTPVTVIEALAGGCPVVTTNVGGLPDLLDGGKLGRLVASENVEALTEGIRTTLTQPPSPESTANTQAIMINRYGIDRLVQDLDGLYRGLLSKKLKAKR